MPQLLPLLVAVGANAAYGATVAFFASLGTSLVVNAYEARRAERKARDAYNASLRDRLVMTATTDKARSKLYGRVRNCDGILFKATHGVHKEFYTFVIALGIGPIQEIEDVFFDDTLVTLDSEGYVQTEPYMQFNKSTEQASFGLDAAGNGQVDLGATPVAGSISLTASGSIDNSPPEPITYTLEGTLVKVQNQPAYALLTVNVVWQKAVGDSCARVRPYVGLESQDISNELRELVPDLIQSGVHRFSGIALLLVTLKYNADAFPTGVPSISATVHGSKVLDIRNNTTAYSENNALIALDWARYKYGGDLALSEIISPSFIDAANACDTLAEFFVLTASSAGQLYQNLPRYICGIVAPTDAGPDRVFNDMVAAMAGQWGWSGGRLRVRAGAWRAPVATITEDWISDKGAIVINPGTPTQETINILRPTISDALRDFVVSPVPEIRSQVYIEADGQEQPEEIQLPGVTLQYRAADICEVRMLEARQALTVALPCKLHAFQLDLFDIVAVTLPHYGWNAKTFEVLGWSFTVDGGVRLVLRESVASIFDVATQFTVDDIVDNTDLPKPWIVIAPTNLSVTSVAQLDNDNQIVTRTLVTWSPITDAAVLNGGHVEIQWAGLGLSPLTPSWVNELGATITWRNNFDSFLNWVLERSAQLQDSDWNSRREPGSSTSTTVVGLRSGFVYVFRARAVNAIPVHSPWSVQQAIVIPIVGLTDAAALAQAVAAANQAAASAAVAAAAAANAGAQVDAAIEAAESAAAAATAATTAITNFSSDNILSPVEKMQVIQQYATIVAEQPGIENRADAFDIEGTELTNYQNAVGALTTYLNTLTSPVAWNVTSGDTTIVGSTFRQNFVNVYTTRQVLLNKIAEVAGTRAAWTSISGIPYASIYTNDDSVALGLNPTFSAWTAAYPDGWVQWAGAAPTKETVLVRIGNYSVRWAAAGGDLGMQATSSWTATPMGVGTFVAGSIDIYLVSRTSGSPAVVVDLFTNAGLTTSVQTVVGPPSLGTGNWQRVTFTARVGDADRIYGIRIYLRASWAANPAGAFVGNVIFSNLRLAFFDQSIDNTKITIAANGALSGGGGGQVTISGLGYTGDLDATYGADASNFFGHIGAGNLVYQSAFRIDTNADGIADLWSVVNGSPGPEPITPTIAEGGGMFGGDAQVVTWSVNNTSTKGIAPNGNAGSGVLGGWEPQHTYVVSFYARASGTNIGKTMELLWTTAPTSTDILLNPALTSAFQRYAFRITWGASVQSAGRFFFSIASNSLSQGGLSFSAVMVSKGDVLTEYVESVEDIRLAAVNAQTTADQAYADAQTALAGIGNAVSDNIITPVEKKTIVLNVQVLLSEQEGIDDTAESHAITTQRTAYNAALDALTDYLATLTSPYAWNDFAGSTNVVGTTFRQKFQDAYDARQALLNAIAEKDLAVANTALSDAAAAQSQAQQAAINANAAIAEINNMTADNILSPVEKFALVRDYNVIIAEQAGIDAQATAYNITTEKVAYDAAVTALTNYLATLNTPTLWSDMSGSTTIVGATLRTRFASVYTTKQAVLNKIAAIAGTLATWAGVTGTGRPADNATVGATVDVNLFDQFGVIAGSRFRNNLVDPSWWSPGAPFQWTLNQTNAGENSIVWGIGPKGGMQALWKCIAAGTPGVDADGGWQENDATATNSFRVDSSRTYRFVVPVKRESGTGDTYWGVSGSRVCNLNTSTVNTNPYFASHSALPAGKWFLLVGYVFPAGATGLTNAGAGVYDMTTGALLVGGINFNWVASTTQASTRAYQYYASTGAVQYFAQPLVNVVDGTEPSLKELLASTAVLNIDQQWTDIFGRPKAYRAVARGFTDTTSPLGSGLYDGETNAIISFAARSYIVNVFDRATGALLSGTIYDVYGSAANATTMAAQLNTLNTTHVVCVRSDDEPQTNRLANGLEAAMYRCGASRPMFGSPEFKARGAYVLVGIPGCGEGNGFESRGGNVDNDTNAFCDVLFTLKAGNLMVTGANSTPGTLRDYNYTGSLAATSDITLVPGFGNVRIEGNNVTKLGTTFDWDTSVHSTEGFEGGAYAQGTYTAGTDIMVGLNTDPSTDGSYASIDFACYGSGNNEMVVYENGVLQGAFGSLTTGQQMAVTYDGAYVRYYKAGALVHSHTAAAGLRLFLDTSIHTPNGTIKNLRFGPMSPVTGINTVQIENSAISTPKIEPGAVTTATFKSHAGGSVSSSSGTQLVTVVSETYNNTSAEAVLLQIDYSVIGNISGGGGGFGRFEFSHTISAGGGAAADAGPVLGTAESSQTMIQQTSVPAGRTVTIEMQARASQVSGTITTNWRSAYMRVTVIKR